MLRLKQKQQAISQKAAGRTQRPCHRHASPRRQVRARVSEEEVVVFQAFDNSRLTARPAQKAAPAHPDAARRIFVAIDDTEYATNACSWLAKHICREGDVVHLGHVACNERAGMMSVGITGPQGYPMNVSMDSDVNSPAYKDYLSRLRDDADAVLNARALSVLNAANVMCDSHVEVISSSKSAAHIADALVRQAEEVGAEILVVASHGGGVLCDYGSVARYCVEHFSKAVLLVPPDHVDGEAADAERGSMAVAVNTLAELQHATTWCFDHLHRDGDAVHILRVDEEVIEPGSSRDPMSMLLGMDEQTKRHKAKNISMTQLQPTAPPDASHDAKNHQAAEAVLDAVHGGRERVLVMVNYATRGLLQEMMYGSLAKMCSRGTRVPMVLIPAESD